MSIKNPTPQELEAARAVLANAGELTRDPTPPVRGALRDGVTVGAASAFIAWASGAARHATAAQFGDPALGEVAGQAVAEYGPMAFGMVGMVVAGGFTLVRKWGADRGIW